jgi:hypothetical protein
MTKHLTIKEAVMSLVLLHPDWTSDQIMIELAELNFDLPTRFFVSSVKLRFKADLKFLIKAGVIDPDPRPTGPLHPDLRRKKVRRSKPEVLPYRRHFYAKDHD